ncbi:phragmoplast orienting kinesin 2-like [Pyrus ussuriensis x Pyrus communis]|uniref:Phragmoplast orienting kinesin 2-like n=1 Tax=Pyrus ussuriensis x Pyrus communis TaxID=2448454 RepID=A0A5N5FII9_9ROSA|nr:phragmoplast orienting kinesin 2-like [Pyrus ussuriensis x Pyrus communis]
MLRDFKFLRSNSGRKEEAENVPVNPKDSSAIRIGSESRAPFNPIQDPVQQPKPEQEVGIRSRVEKTPTKAPKGKVSDPALPLRTPDRYGSRKRFGWAQKTEPISTTAGDLHEDGANYSTQVSRGGGGAGNGGLGSVTPRVTRTVGRAASSYSESNSTQTTPTKSVSKPPNSGFRNKADGSVGPRVGNFASLYKGIPISCGPSTVVNSVEVPHFDLKEDPSFWMDHNVQVLIRVRPLNSMERSLHGYNRCLKQESAQTISWIGQPESRFTFDHVACETVDQEMLFRMAGLPMVENCLSGYNSCMFAYGQTGSGKTHTMLGEIDDLETKPSPHRGMTPRIFEFLFARIQAEEEIRRDEKLKYNCKCSFLEIYNEQITDLLDPSSTNLLLREDVKQGVYVENLSEFEVYTVSDILRLLIQGSSNRRVAATNMNRESSRSHSVFTCVIESRWEKDSTTNLRFARLNLVDLAGSERQKTSGAEGERLKEAANINKSLSTLGHVIMVLVDMAHGKLKHVPYRDSRLTFLLQDSLGGNSKTMIIANVSPSICCAAETLSTLKFAQRAKLIQNNAVVNEDATGDVMALQHQIRLLKEQLSILKRHNVSRPLSFCSTNFEDTQRVRKIDCGENLCDMDLECDDDFLENQSKGAVRLSTKKLKSLETTLAGALRREQIAEATIKQLEAENEQLNHLVCQREEDTRGTKMMLRFREDKIQKMESLLSGSIPVESYLLDENRALSEEIQLIQAKLDKNPEVTRFALENIRLLDQLRRFEEFYEEGEREMLLDEVSKLRDQLFQFLDGHSKQHGNPNFSMKTQETVCTDRDSDSLNMELKNTVHELEECRRSLNTCLEENEKLNREIDDLQTMLNKLKCTPIDQNDCVALKVHNAVPIEEMEPKLDPRIKHAQEILNLQLELDIVNIILKEERTSQEERVYFLNKDLHLANEEIFVISKQHDDASRQLEEAKSVIEALESQQLLSINELEDLRKLLSERELELRALKEQRTLKEFRDLSPSNCSNNHDSPLQGNLKRMHDSLEKAKRLNTWYQSDRAFQVSNEEEMDEVRRQVEAETAEVIVCMQEELGMLQQQVQNSHLKDLEMNKNVMILETELKEVREKLYILNEDNGRLSKELEEKDGKVRTLSREWTLLSSEIEEVLSDGCEELDGASDQLNLISNSFPQKRIWLSEQVGRTVRIISEKEYLIEELRRCLEDANNKKNEVECMLKSMRGATLAITEAHEQECCEKEKEMLMLTTKLNAKSSRVEKLENRVKLLEDQIRKTSVCATVAFVVVDKLAEMNRGNEDALKCKNIQLSESEDLISTKVAILSDQETVIAEAEKKVHSLSGEVEELERTCADLRQELSEERECAFTIQQKLEDVEEKTILMAREKLAELKTGVSTLRSGMNTNVEHHTSSEGKDSQLSSKSSKGEGGGWIATETILDQNGNEQFVEDLTADKPDMSECTLKVRKSMCANSTREDLKSERPSKAKAGSGRDVTILLLKKEIETALDSLKEVQAEMDKLREENKLMCKSEQQSRESMKYLRTQIINLHSTMKNLEKQSKVKLEAQDHKLEVCQQMVQEAGSQWCQTKEMMEMEFDDAKLVAAQKTAEVSCILPKFEEAQDIIKEADNMINKLMISNKTMKLEIKRLKKLEASLISDKDMLLNEVQSLQSINYLSSQRFAEVEDLLTSDITETKALVVELEGMLAGIQAHYNENFILLASDFQSVKSLLSNSSKLIRSSVEDIWSEIIVKDCAVSVLHLCHMGIFLETVTGLNAENGLLQHGICESSTLIADLRQHNVRSQRELEMCQILKGKLLADIKNSYDHISRREEEAGKLSTKVNTFEKQISELQFQEELMLQRSNYMGSQLAILMKELDLSNSNFGASLLKQEKFLKEKEEAFESQVECFMIEWCSKDFESLILASELEVMAKHKADMEREHITCCAMLEDFKKEVIFSKVDTLLKGQFLLDEEVEVACLQMEAQKERQHLLSLLNQSSLRVAQMNEEKKALEQEIMLLKDVSLLNDALKGELGEAKQTEMKLLCQVQALEAEYQKLREDLNTKEMNLEISAHQFSVLEQENQRLQNDILTLQTSSDGLQDVLEKKKAELSRLNCLETENESLKTEIEKLNTENSMALKHLEQKNSEFSSSLSRISVFDKENCRLQDEIFSLEIHIVNLETHLRAKNAELDELLTISSAKAKKCVDSVETLDSANNRSCNIIREEGFMIVDKMSQELCETGERISQFIEQVNCLECQAKELVSENFSLRAELLRKDDVLNGLLFDLSLLQESASNNKDHQDEIAEMESSLEALEDELSAKSCELEETMANSQMLETQLQEKRDIISALEQGLLEERESLKFLSHENLELRAQVEDALATRTSVEKELTEKQKITESLKMEVLEMSNALDQMNDSNESLRDNLNELANEKDLLHTEMLQLKEKFEGELARADEIEAIANEAQQIAELRKIYADDKEAEVKLLERSVEELERTVDVLENKVDIVKGEAERQRLYGEELELELHAVEHQMQNVENANADMKRYLGEKEKALQEARHNIQILEKELAEKDAEIAQFKAHISELNLHAEAQACEYKQKFKVLESMAEQVRPESHSTHATSSSSNKSEKHAAKPRGSGSPFKCIGLGMAQQIKSEKDEDLTAARVRIEELESLAFSRQKEIFALNARLAAAESMTHDVIRDLLGVKLDMTSYVSLLDNQQVQKITEKARLHSVESQEKEQEVAKLKKQLSEFIQERQGWLEEIDRKQAELIAVQIALEKLKQRDQLLKTENEMLKAENVNHKMRVMELEGEVDKLSGQQNLHQRIHHHAKIKEENHKLKVQNEELSNKLRRTEVILSRVKEELACFRASCGKNPCVDFDEEQRLGAKLKETEEEKLQLAQKLLGLCSSVLKAAGITKQSTHINPSAAEEVLEQIKNKITSMDRELQDLKFKNKISSERIRLSQLMPQTSPLSSRKDENSQTPKRTSQQAPYFSALDR